jgi:hypothetical protein
VSVPPSDDELSSMRPLTRARRVRRMLLPKAVRYAVSSLNRDDSHLPKWNARLRSLDRLNEWAQCSKTMRELQHRILDSDHIGNLMELSLAFTWFIQRLEEGAIDESTIDTKPLSIACQVIVWWTDSMKRMDAKLNVNQSQ